MPSLLVQVRKKMSITAHRKVRNVLDGEYGSVFKGRSMDFDDLREYIVGDDVKDIDWKATARSGQVLIKRYIAIRKHNIMLVVNTGRDMSATAQGGELKRDIAVMAAGVIAYVAQRHGDLIALVAGDKRAVKYLPLKGDTSHIERILQYIDTHCRLESPPSDMVKVLDYIARTVKRRMMLIVVSDELEISKEQEQLLRRLSAQHEIMYITIDDIVPSNSNWRDKEVRDIERQIFLPSFIRGRSEIDEAYSQFLQNSKQKMSQQLEHLRISNVRIGSESEVISQVVRLLEEQKRARRR